MAAVCLNELAVFPPSPALGGPCSPPPAINRSIFDDVSEGQYDNQSLLVSEYLVKFHYTFRSNDFAVIFCFAMKLHQSLLCVRKLLDLTNNTAIL